MVFFLTYYLLLPTVFLLSLVCRPDSLRGEGFERQADPIKEQDFSSLNIRMSNRPLSPPPDLVEQTIPLEGISVARPFVAPAPQAAILENDQRRRVALLSQNPEGIWLLYLLEPISLDPKLPALFQCASERQCAVDRMPMTGGLTCLALCVKELIEATVMENH